ncbi:hypothetical protein PLICRDRAFT_358606 [Plicaturopsis crispa FD-325 SS-3]|uniref:MYND-type domain-containing protein n=1 Tax=Plicaturopsis crispa FD-325 SS-3 TaxID=944288 RepID=A0A0C9SR27_PLICR|nr:hypothetical protein PLICRDRAFT_358606 [Plicaturopsis crispa FD-325 SS-3]
MYDPMVQAVQRQLKTGSVATTASMNGIASILLTNFPSIANHSMPFLIDMLEKTDLMDVAAQGLVITDANGTNHWMKFFERAVHIVDCKNARCPYLSTTAYMKVCKERLEAVYFPTGYALRKNGPKNPKTLQLWEQFASVMGVDEAALLTKWKADKQCCNPLCKRRGEGPNAIVMKCTACQSVYYHGSACQKADWKRHKHECKKA